MKMASNLQQMAILKRSPFPGFCGKTRSRSAVTKPTLSELQVKTFLIKNPKVFESFVLESVAESKLAELLKKKRERPTFPGIPEATINLQPLYMKEMVRDIAEVLTNHNIEEELQARIEEAAKVLGLAVNANDIAIYVPTHNESILSIYQNGKLVPCGPVGKNLTVAAHSVFEKKTLIVNDLQMDQRFPKGRSPNGTRDCSVLCVPVVLPTDDTAAVIEFTRDHFKPPFSDGDLQLVHTVVAWMAACIHENGLKRILDTEQKLNDFLLEITKGLFKEMTCVDTVSEKILVFAKDLVKADRCTMVLADDDQSSFTQYTNTGLKGDNNERSFEKRKIQSLETMDKIMDDVLKNGKTINIYDAYEDIRFDSKEDKDSGYRTRNILCMSIHNKSQVIGVVKMVNSLHGDHFTHADEEYFRLFAVYCAMALHYSKIYSLLNQQQNMLKVAVDVLQYHLVCNEDDVLALQEKPYIEEGNIPSDFASIDFYAYHHVEILPQLFNHMLKDLFGENPFELEKLCRFILTVRKNYRSVSYHNWEHGFHVSHALWQMLKSNEGIFSSFEKMAFIIAGICHDIDHRGYNNAFFTRLDLPLAALYSTSVMEQHHYKQMIIILHAEGQNIFSFLDGSKYKEMLELIRSHIIATDLALYFENQKELERILKEGTADLNDTATRTRCEALMMTASDLCAVAKPWKTQQETVDRLYDEFYTQGDEEKKRGLEPIPMMDRNTIKDQPKQQIGFHNFICIPLYRTLSEILPGCKPFLDGCLSNKEKWSDVIAQDE